MLQTKNDDFVKTLKISQKSGLQNLVINLYHVTLRKYKKLENIFPV